MLRGLLPRLGAFLEPFARGEKIGCYALTEPQAGSNAAALQTKAVKDGDKYIVNGTKAWITNGGRADSYTLFARTSPEGSRGISCFLVPSDSPGLTFGKPEDKMGLRAVPTTSAFYENVPLGATPIFWGGSRWVGSETATIDMRPNANMSGARR